MNRHRPVSGTCSRLRVQRSVHMGRQQLSPEVIDSLYDVITCGEDNQSSEDLRPIIPLVHVPWLQWVGRKAGITSVTGRTGRERSKQSWSLWKEWTTGLNQP
jgi:hypothetical protein